jgi:glycosyltransferase involved in cell wall biosynthesis
VCRSTYGPVRTIRNGASAAPVDRRDLEARSRGRAQLGLEEGALVIASIGRLDADKGPDLLIDAFARMKRDLEPLPQLLFVGEGPMRDLLRERAEVEGIADRVGFAGLRSDLRELLPAFDVVAFSSPTEGLSISLLETMAAGGCLVATDVPGNREALSADLEALLVPPGDPEAFAVALSRAATDPALRARVGGAARKRFQAEFSAEGMVSAYESLYREVAGGGPSAASLPGVR